LVDARQRILGAALPLVDERGAVAVSADEIRVRAGVSVGSLYHHFPAGKPAIIAALLDHWLRRYQVEATEVLHKHTDYASGVPAMVRHFLGWVHEHPAAARILLRFEHDSVLHKRQHLDGAGPDFGHEIAGWLERHGPGDGQPVPLHLLLAVWIGPAKEYARGWLNGRAGQPFDEAATVLAMSALHALRQLSLETPGGSP
jgi:AcrR family transcriptional regulator